MEEHPLSIADLAPEDWESTPAPVKQLVEALLARVKQDGVLLEHKSRLTQLDADPITIPVHASTGRLASMTPVEHELLGSDRPSQPQPNLLPEIFQIYRPSSKGRRLVGGVALDVTDLKQSQIALEKSEQRFRNLFESIPKIAIQGYNRHRQVIYWNDASAQLYGYSKTEALGQQLEDLIIPPEIRPAVIAAVQNWLTDNQPIPASELSLVHQDGSRVEVYSSHAMLTNLDGEPEMYCVDIDLSDRNRAEAALRESETTNRAILNAFPDLLLRVQRDGTCHDFIPPTDAPSTTFLPIHHHVAEVLPPDILQHFLQRTAHTLATGELQVWEHQILKYDRLCDEEIRLVPCGTDECLVVVRDITDRKRAEALLNQREQALRQRVGQEQTLRRVLQAIRQSLNLDLIFRTATVEIALLVQASRSAVVQYVPERQCWKHISEYRESLDIPDTLGTEIPDQDNPLAEQLKQFKVVRIDNSEVIEDEINQEFAQILPGSWLLVPLIVDQKLWGSFSMVRFQPTSPWTEEEATLVQTIADQLAIAIQQAQAFERAQTEIAERQQAEADLRSALAEKEVLLKEIHHRVKNNLQIVSGLLQLQAQSLQDSPAVYALRESRNRVESMSLIHKKLYISSDLEQIDAADYIQSLATSLLITYKVSPGAIALQVEVEPVILSLDQGIPCGLIINELVSNALKYAFSAHQAGEILIQLRQLGHELELIIQDNGIGLPDHLDLTNIQSLGLSLVHALSTEQLEGSFAVDRSQGTRFRIKFPQSAS